MMDANQAIVTLPWPIVIHSQAEGVWRQINNRNNSEQDRREVAKCKEWQREIELIAAGIYAAIVEEQERCTQVAFNVGYAFCDEAGEKYYAPDGHSQKLVIEVTEAIAAAIRGD